MTTRSQDFSRPITEPACFVGRVDELTTIRTSPFRCRFVFGGPGMGKSSLLRALEWELIERSRALPVRIDLRLVDTATPDEFRCSFFRGLCQGIARWQAARTSPPDGRYEAFRAELRDIDERPLREGATTMTKDEATRAFRKRLEDLRALERDGVVFLMDHGEVVESQGRGVATQAWDYLNALYESDFSARLGLVITGFKRIRNLSHDGSALSGKAERFWLHSWSPQEAHDAIERRMRGRQDLTADEQQQIVRMAGGHPFLTQRLLTARLEGTDFDPGSLDAVFVRWWGQDMTEPPPDCLGGHERTAYRAILQRPNGGVTDGELAKELGWSVGQCRTTLIPLVATGLVREAGGRYQLGAELFATWLSQRGPAQTLESERRFLDHARVDWSRPAARTLLDTLVKAYDQIHRVRPVAQNTGVDLRHYSPEGGVEGAWRSVITEAANQGLLRALVQVCVKDGSIAAHHPALERLLLEP